MHKLRFGVHVYAYTRIQNPPNNVIIAVFMPKIMCSQNSAQNFDSKCTDVLCCLLVNDCISTLDFMFEGVFLQQIMKK